MSLSSYFVKKKQNKKNHYLNQESEIKSSVNNDDAYVDNAGRASQNINNDEKFSFQFFNNMSSEEQQREDSSFKFGFLVSNEEEDGDVNKKSKKKRRKRKKKTKSTMSTVVRDANLEAEEKKQQQDQNQCIRLEPNIIETLAEGNEDNRDNNLATSNKKERKRKKKSEKKKLCRSIESGSFQNDDHEEEKEKELNLKAMESFVETSRNLMTDRIQNYSRDESNRGQNCKQQMKDNECSNEKRGMLKRIEGKGNRNMKGDGRSSKNASKIGNNIETNTVMKKKKENRELSAGSVASRKGKKSKKTPSIQRQAQLKSIEEKKSLNIHKKSKTTTQDRTLQFNSSDKGKAMVNHGSIAVYREKTKLLKQQQQNHDEKDKILQKESNPFSFGFHFNSILPQSPESLKN